MVNRVPAYAYVIGEGGRIAILSSRQHPNVSGVMVPACCDALESTGVSSDDIYIIDSPSDALLPGLSREISKSGFYSAVAVLAVLPSGEALAESVLNGMTMTDFSVPVVPGVVIGEHDASTLARVASDAGRAAVEMTNLGGMLLEMKLVSELSDAAAEVEAEGEEVAAPAPSRKRKAPAASKRTGKRASARKTSTARRGRSRK